ncbi:MAG: flagellar motor switch protein FliG [Deltaproteobacteria bacterium]|nr:flagellar motor switch protein FliG [Deltaproteobacteria bacterium]
MKNEEKAAVMLLSLEEDLAANVMKNLRPAEIRRIGKYMNRITTIPSETVNAVAKEFLVMAKERGGSLAVNDKTTRSIFTKALGEKDAQEILAEVADSKIGENPITEKLRDIDPKILMDFTRTEHPQTIALILAHLTPEQAAVMLEDFSGAMQTEITKRMATLKSVPQEFLEDVAETLEKEIVTGNVMDQQIGGIKFMSEILNRMNRNTESEILAALDEEDAELAAELRGLMFTFEDVLKLDDKSLQELLREITTEDLAKALKLVDESAREKIFKNMSKRGAEMLKEDIELMPPIRLSEVEASQREILDVTKRLEAEGKILILRGAEEDEFI